MFYTLIALFLLFLLPSICSAVELEQTYPHLSATKAITKTSSIAELITYLSTWAIVITVLVVVISLITAGIQYLTSSGRPETMTDAKSRIYKSFLGLAILAGSYLILVTVNPQLTVLTLEYVPVETGLFLFTEQGYDEFTKDNGFAMFDDLIKQKQIYPLTHDIEDMTMPYELGELAVEKWHQPPSLTPPIAEGIAEKVNFINFPLYALGFWGLLEQDAKVVMYSQENFQGSKYEYTFEGKLDEQGALKREYGQPRHGMELMVFNLDFDSPLPGGSSPDPDFFKTIKKTATDPGFHVDYVNLKADVYSQLLDQQKEQIKRDLELARRLDVPPPGSGYEDVKSRYESDAIDGLIYPPLSLQIRRTGPGVYLYADANNHNEERRFTESQEDLSQSGIDFDKKAEKIKLINTEHDYLAVLHEDPHLTGNLRLFFEQRLDHTEQIPIVCDDGRPLLMFSNPASPVADTVCGFDGFNTDPTSPDYKTVEEYLEGLSYNPDNGPTQLIIGNLGDVGNPADSSDDVPAAESPTLIAEQDEYGEVEYVSSISVFELNPDPRSCKEVRLCTEKGFETGQAGGEGYCISYSYEGANTKTVPEVGVVKFPVPLYQPVNIPDKAKVVKSKDDDGNITGLEEEDFAQEIRSLYIQGDCLVALFENKIGDWSANGPGAHSQVFSGSKQDLSRYQIGRCGSALRRITGRYLAKPCAQAIAVFPIVNIGGENGSAPLPAPPSAGSSGGWRECVVAAPKEQQIRDASPALVSALNCIAGKYPPQKPCNWVVTSISDSHGLGMGSGQCPGDPYPGQCVGSSGAGCCWHTEFSCHYGGENCSGQASYAADIDNIGDKDRFVQAALECRSNNVWLKDEGTHLHLSIGCFEGCGCDPKSGSCNSGY